MRIASSIRRVPYGVRVGSVLRRLKGNCHVALSGEVVDFVRLYLLNDADKVGRIRKVSVMQMEPDVLLVRILVEMIDAVGVERGGPSLDTVDFIAFTEQQLGQVGTILSGDSRD